jgi:hypothetical protein
VIKDLTINGGTTTLASPVDITAGTAQNTFGTVTVVNGATLASNGFLTIKSNEHGTARVAEGFTNNYITGNVTVERYIPANGKRAWRMLSVPTQGSQSIKGAWQEGATAGNQDPVTNFGTIITSNNANWASSGYDFQTAAASLLTYNSGNNTWSAVSSTNNNIQTVKGYSLFIRGDRSVLPSSSTATNTPTTLRTTGTLYMGAQPEVNVTAGTFDLVGNTYASAIDFTQLPRTGGVGATFYVWDPKATNGSGTSLGAYQTFSPLTSPAYRALIPGSYGTSAPFRVNTNIESGQAFFVTAAGTDGTIALTESAKVAGEGFNVFRPQGGGNTLSNLQRITTNLRLNEANNNEIIDAAVTAMATNFNNQIDQDDAFKMSNPGENLAQVRAGKNLVVEARQPVTIRDSIFFTTWNMQAKKYQMEFLPEHLNVPGLTAVLQDRFLNTNTPVNLSATATTYNFEVTGNPASAAADRFVLVLTQAGAAPLPVNFVTVNAIRTGASVQVKWQVAAERNIRSYSLERSADGRNFNGIAQVEATNSTEAQKWYNATDLMQPAGTVFYRVRANELDGSFKYSAIVRVNGLDTKSGISINPNPVEGTSFHLQLNSIAAGEYQLMVINATGAKIYQQRLQHAGGSASQTISLPASFAAGNYQVILMSKNKKLMTTSLLAQ